MYVYIDSEAEAGADYFWENIEPVEEDDGERLNEMSPASEGGADRITKAEDLTEDR